MITVFVKSFEMAKGNYLIFRAFFARIIEEIMIQLILVLLVLLWLTGYIHIPFLNSILFSFANHPFTLQSLLFLILIIFVINFLPGIFRTLVLILLFLWLLSVFGFFIFGGLGNVFLLILILFVLFSLF